MREKPSLKAIAAAIREKRDANRKEKLENIDKNERLNRIVDRRYNRLNKKKDKAAGDEKKLEKIEKKFGYNYESAIKSGATPDETGDWPSVNPDTREILKARRHPSMIKTRKAEKYLGNKIVKEGDKRYSRPKR